MNLIARYVLCEVLKTFGATLAALTVLMLIVGVAQEAVAQGLGLLPIVKLTPYVLPGALRFAIPGTILFAVCSVYGRMAAANEVIAVRAMGVSPLALVWPTLAFSIALSMVAVWVNDVAMSWGRRGVYEVVLQSVEQVAYGRLRTHRQYTNERGFSILVQRVSGRKLERMTLVFPIREGFVTLFAREAELKSDGRRGVLRFILTDGEVEWPGRGRLRFTDSLAYELPLAGASRKGEADFLTDCALHELPGRVRLAREEIAGLERSFAEEAERAPKEGMFSGPQGEYLRERMLAYIAFKRARLRSLCLEPWRRWANGFSCFCFALVGAPLAIRMKSADVFAAFGACFLPILIVYYPLLAYGIDRAKAGAVSPACVWLANLVLAAIGAWLLRRVIRR
jgi:lipopolysaccharide export system permease protein